MKHLPFFILMCLGTLLHAQHDSLTLEELKQKIPQFKIDEGVTAYGGKQLPAFALLGLDGSLVRSEGLKGKPVLLNFWFENCAPCIEEIPSLNALQQRFGERVHFVAVTFNSAATVTKFLSAHPWGYRQLVDARPYIKQIDIKFYPKSLILDKNGVVQQIVTGGFRDMEAFEQGLSGVLEKLLEE